MDNSKKYVDLEGLKYFLEKLKYELAHNGPKEQDIEKDTKENENG